MVEVLNFIFRLGVVFAIFGFLWWLISAGLMILRGGRPASVPETYIIRMVRYFFLVDVAFLFCLNQANDILDVQNSLITGLILLTYFIGKLQSGQLRKQLFSFQAYGNAQLLSQFKPVFNFKAELIVILLSIGFFTLFMFYPTLASNPISEWFFESIIDIEDTPVFGFIFKVIGFFFMLSILMKFVNGFMTLLSGGKINPPSNDFDKRKKKENDFDDYEEI
jgi:hypothetical protein